MRRRDSNVSPYPTFHAVRSEQPGGDFVAPVDIGIPARYNLRVSWYEEHRPVGLSFIILTRNEKGNVLFNLAQVLAVLKRRLPCERSIPIELVIVDNGSNDGTRDAIVTWVREQGIELFMSEGGGDVDNVNRRSSYDYDLAIAQDPRGRDWKRHISVTYHSYPYHIAKPGLETYVTPPNTVHSVVYLTQWAMQQCTLKYTMIWNADFIMNDAFWDAVMSRISQANPTSTNVDENDRSHDFDSCRMTVIDAGGVQNDEYRINNTYSNPCYMKDGFWEFREFTFPVNRVLQIPKEEAYAKRLRNLATRKSHYNEAPWWATVENDCGADWVTLPLGVVSSYLMCVRAIHLAYERMRRLLPANIQLFTRANDPKSDELLSRLNREPERLPLYDILRHFYDRVWVPAEFVSSHPDCAARVHRADYSRRRVFFSDFRAVDYAADNIYRDVLTQRVQRDLMRGRGSDGGGGLQKPATREQYDPELAMRDAYARCANLLIDGNAITVHEQQSAIFGHYQRLLPEYIAAERDYQSQAGFFDNADAVLRLATQRWRADRTAEERRGMTMVGYITTCKRPGLFATTMRSLLRHCTDIFRIDEWICIDDNSSDSDREAMQKEFPWMRFVWKRPDQKSHAKSMNMLQELIAQEYPSCQYLFATEDDWLYLNDTDLVGQSLRVLAQYRDVGQCLLVQNYQEEHNVEAAFSGDRVYRNGVVPAHMIHRPLSGDALAAFNQQNPRNHAWWPGYSLRPSVTRAAVWQRTGPFSETPGCNFEHEFATRYHAEQHFRTAMLYLFHAETIGAPTYRRSVENPNAYILNGFSC